MSWFGRRPKLSVRTRSLLAGAALLALLGGMASYSPPRPRAPSYLGRYVADWRAECQHWKIIEESWGDCHWGEPYSIWARRPRLSREDKLPLLAGDPAAVPVLMELLASGDAKARRIAAEGLGQAGPAAKPSVRALVVAARDADGDVAMAAMLAISRVYKERPGEARLTWSPSGYPELYWP